MWYEFLTQGILWITGFSLLVTLPIYLLVLIVIYINRRKDPFNSEFFVIFLALGVVDIACYFLYLFKKAFILGYIPQSFEPLNEPNFLVSLLAFPFWFFSFMQYHLMFLLTLNRFISIVYPNFYTTRWKKGRSNLLVLICCIESAILAFPILFADCYVDKYTAQLDGVNRTLYNAPISKSLGIVKYITTVFSINVYGLTSSCVIFYLIMLRTLRNTPAINNRRKIEMQMFWVGLFLVILNLLFVVYIISRNTTLFDSLKQPHLHEWILLFISDIYDLPNGVMLLLTSTNIRNIIRRTYQHRFTSVGSSSVSNTPILIGMLKPNNNVNLLSNPIGSPQQQRTSVFSIRISP